MESSTVLAIIGSNCLLSALVLAMAVKLWCWRCDLVRLTAWLPSLVERSIYDRIDSDGHNSLEMVSKQIGLALMVKRSHIAETRLRVSRLKLISYQVNQLLELLRFLILVSRRRRRASYLSRPSTNK